MYEQSIWYGLSSSDLSIVISVIYITLQPDSPCQKYWTISQAQEGEEYSLMRRDIEVGVVAWV